MPGDRIEQQRGARNDATWTFGQRVRDQRRTQGLSQEAASMRCGIHWTQLGKVERGQRSLRLETILKIADGLNIDAGDLMRDLHPPDRGTHPLPP